MPATNGGIPRIDPADDVSMYNEAHSAAVARLYGPTAADLARPLTDVGEALAAQLQTLAMDPTPDGAERVAINLNGALRAVRQLQEQLLREVGHVR